MGLEKTRRILYNSDGWNIFANFAHRGEPLTVEQMRGYVTEVANTQVDTFVLCVNAGLAYFPDGPLPMYGSPGHQTQGTDDAVGPNLTSLVSRGVDPVGVLIDTINECGLECILSYRMNDAHHLEPDTPLMPDFWKQHPEWRTDPKASHGGGAYDYSLPGVQRYMLDQLKYLVDRYGSKIDGLELDWLRFPRNFNPGEEKPNILTQFTREVRRFVKAPLKLAARVWHRPERCVEFGMDPYTWAGEGLIDFLTISRFLRNGEGPLDVQGFKARIRNIPIYGSIEVGSHNVWPRTPEERAIYDAQVRPHLMADDEDYRNEALTLWRDGIDGVYLFNFFTVREDEYKLDPPFHLLNELGDARTIKAPTRPLRYYRSVAELLADVKK